MHRLDSDWSVGGVSEQFVGQSVKKVVEHRLPVEVLEAEQRQRRQGFPEWVPAHHVQTRAVLNELFDLRVGELEAGQRFDDLVRQGKVVYERVRTERQNHLGCGKLSQNTGHQLQCHLGEPQLVEEEDRPPGSRLPSVDFRKDALHGTLEGLRVEDDVLVVVL